jgi:PAS domain S-box-containing protein
MFKSQKAHRQLRYAIKLAVLAAAYFASAKAGLAMASEHFSITAVWPPTGIALAATVIWGYRVWPGIALGAFLANIGGPPLGSVLAMATGNTLEALVGAYLLSRVDFRPSMDRIRDVGALLFLAAALSTIVSASIGVLALWAGGEVTAGDSAAAWRIWWFGDMGGDLLVAAPLLVLASWRAVVPPLVRVGEAALVIGGLTAVCALVLPNDSPLAYVVLPLLFWTALRFGQLGAVLASLLVSGLAIYFTSRGLGPFVGGSPDAELLRAQTFVGVGAVTALFVAAVRNERREAENALELLADRERQLAQAQELAHIGSWEWDIPSNNVSWSDELYRIYGVRRGEFNTSYEGWLELVLPDDRDRTDRIVQKAFREASPFHYYHRFRHPDGDVRILDAHGEVIVGPDGRPLKMRGTSQDITAAEAKFRQLLDLTPDAIIGIGEDGRIELVSRQVEEIFGYSHDELVGQSVELLVPERFRAGHEDRRSNYFQDPRTRPMGAGLELYARRRDGTEFPCEISLSSIATERGVMGIAAVRDITERKSIQAESERLKSEFFGLVSHELRTPLTSIVGYLEMLAERERENLSEEGQDFIDVIGRNSERLDGLVQDLLLVTQVEAGTFEIEMGRVDIGEVIEGCEREAKILAGRSEVELECRMEPVRPFAGDPKRLTQVLSNLVSNAIKFTPPGGRVEGSVREENGSCVIEISDSGMGIAEEELPHLFDRFYRSEDAMREQIKGVGLGLAITKAIVDSHGGEIEVQSVVGAGSTFRVVLPMKAYDNVRPDRQKAEVTR